MVSRRMIRTRIVPGLLCRVLLAVIFLSSGRAAAFEVPRGKTAVFIGQDNATIRRYIERTGHVPAGFMVYTAVNEPEGLDSWSPDYGAGKMNANALLADYPEMSVQIGLYMVGSLRATREGHYDENIDRISAWIRAAGVPVFLRVGYEFDGAHNAYDPDDYREAFRYVVDRIRESGASDVDFVWHSCAKGDVADISPWYPGDDYVDWVGLSYFDQPRDFMLPVVEFARARGKPVMIAEATPAGKLLKSPLAWKIWYQPFFRFVERHDIGVISYINSHWDAMEMWTDLRWRDARIEEYDHIRKLWLESMNAERYQFNWAKGTTE